MRTEKSTKETNAAVFARETQWLLDEKYNGMVSPDENKSVHFDVELNLLEGNYQEVSDSLKEHIEQIADMDIPIANMVGTGYGRALLPFPEDLPAPARKRETR